MTLTTLLIGITIAALLFTALNQFVLRRVENPVVSLLQNFCGALFVFSGWVKAIDPMGGRPLRWSSTSRNSSPRLRQRPLIFWHRFFRGWRNTPLAFRW